MSRFYEPDNFVIISNGEISRVFASWSGGYTEGESWKLASKIERVEIKDDYVHFHNYSGSTYKCHINSEGVVGVHNKAILNNFLDNSPECRIYSLHEYLKEQKEVKRQII